MEDKLRKLETQVLERLETKNYRETAEAVIEVLNEMGLFSDIKSQILALLDEEIAGYDKQLSQDEIFALKQFRQKIE